MPTKEKPIDFKQMDNPSFIADGGFVSQWCCKCGNRHILRLKIREGDKSTGGDFIEINWFQDNVGTKLRKFYKKHFKDKTLE